MAIRFLVVDDATFIRDLVKKQLRDGIPGSEVFDATDGNRAIAQLKKQKVDVILSDWEMPNLSGEEFLQWLRSEEDYKDIPFIMVTSRGDRDHVMKAIKAGASDFITKPFTAEELLKKTMKQLQRIGKSPKDGFTGTSQAQGNQSHAFGSIDALTGGGSAAYTKIETNTRSVGGSSIALTAAAAPAKKAVKPAAPATAAKPQAKKKTQGRAQLRFASGTYACVIRDMSLQAMSGLMQRGDGALPTLFDQAVVDIGGDDGEEVARVNGYISSIAAGENKVDTKIIKITVKFVDNDPDKFEVLSRYIAKTR